MSFSVELTTSKDHYKLRKGQHIVEIVANPFGDGSIVLNGATEYSTDLGPEAFARMCAASRLHRTIAQTLQTLLTRGVLTQF